MLKGTLVAVLLSCLALTCQAAAVPLDRIVAVVNNDVITETELGQRVEVLGKQIVQSGARLPPPSILRSQVLERMISERLQLQLADSTGIRIDDDTLNQTLRRIADDNKLSLGEFRRVLEKDGFSFEVFREDIRRELTLRRLHERQIQQRIVVSEQDVDQFLQSQPADGATTQYRLGHILVALPEAATPEQTAAARDKVNAIIEKLNAGADFGETAIAYSDAQNALEGGDIGWRGSNELPTLFAAAVPKLDVGKFSEPIRGPNGFHIIKVVDKRGDRRIITEETLVRHILLKTHRLRSDEVAEKELTQLKSRIAAGEDFAAIAKSISEDSGSALNGGSLDWVKPGDTVPPFEQTMNQTTKGEISEPFQTEFGWHILQVLDRRETDTTEAARRDEAQRVLRQRKADEETTQWLQRLRDEAFVEVRLEQDSGA